MLTWTAGQDLLTAEQEGVGGGVEPRGPRVSEAVKGRAGQGTGEREEVTRAGKLRSFGPPARGSGEGIGACPQGCKADSEKGLLKVEKAGQLRNDHV